MNTALHLMVLVQIPKILKGNGDIVDELRTEDRELTTADLAGRATATTRPNGREIEPEDEPETIEGELVEEEPGGAPVHPERMERSRSKPMPLFSDSEMQNFRSQWSGLQTGFVDEPRRSVEDADRLVASVMQRLAEGFAGERSGLEKQWDRGDNVSTEDLRVALQRYRSFFDRLLNL